VRACHNEIVAGPNGQRSRSTGSKGLRSWATLWPTQLLARRAHEPLKKMLPHRQRPTKWKEAAGCQSPRHHPLERGALHLLRFNQFSAVALARTSFSSLRRPRAAPANVTAQPSDAPKSVDGFSSTAEEAEYCAEESGDRAKHPKDDRGDGIQHHTDSVPGFAIDVRFSAAVGG
jgi:hypothetical protein